MDLVQLTPEQKAGQRLMVGFDGLEFNSDLEFLIDRLKVGGLILFKRNISDPQQLKALCRSAQQYARSRGQPPLFISIDQEGGVVARLKAPFSEFPGNPSMSSIDDAIHFAAVTASELSEAKVNMNMAPVLDVAFDPDRSIMNDRAFGDNPDWVIKMGTAVIDRLQQGGIISVAKHFPGIGRTTLDSHLDLPRLEIDLDTLTAEDLRPFDAAARRNVAGLMLSHILYPQLDDRWPASLSVKIADQLLRKKMGFNGLVITDDLDMGAVAKHYDIRDCIEQILQAEIDIPLICHQGPNIEIAFEEILRKITDSKRLRSKGDLSVQRILNCKNLFKLAS
jgi:beta-N-acetylhexosaminidase